MRKYIEALIPEVFPDCSQVRQEKGPTYNPKKRLSEERAT